MTIRIRLVTDESKAKSSTWASAISGGPGANRKKDLAKRRVPKMRRNLLRFRFCVEIIIISFNISDIARRFCLGIEGGEKYESKRFEKVFQGSKSEKAS
jgi:hypothetical protein